MKPMLLVINQAVRSEHPFSFICCKVTVVGKEYFDADKW